MSTATAERQRTQTNASTSSHPAPATLNDVQANKTVEFVPMGAGDSIKLSVAIIRLILNPRTSSGRQAPDDQILKFIMLCKARRLDPFEGDAFLIGYEGKDGDAWSLVTSIYAFLKRAEVNPQYEGMESGVIVETAEGAIEEHVGDFLCDDEKLLGGWAIVHRSDRKFPNKKRVEFKRYSTAKSRWAADPGGMICKVAECQALRDTFPTTLGGLYIADELDKDIRTIEPTQINVLPTKGGSLKTKPAANGTPPAAQETPATASPVDQPAECADEGHEAGEIPADAPMTDDEKAAAVAQEAAEATPFDPEKASKEQLTEAIKTHLTRLKKKEVWACSFAGLPQRELSQCTEAGLRAVYRAVSKQGGAS